MGGLVAFAFATSLAASLPADPAEAQVSTDGSLGVQVDVPQVSGDFQITDDLGRYSGNGRNLFHSFSRFDVAAGESASFSASLGTPTNVVARVTGGTTTTIAGALRSTVPDGNLFLLNPAGVLFKEGASLDVQGSFHVSSAETLRFEDGVDFDARSSQPLPDLPCGGGVLSCAAPSAFGFLSDSPARVELARPADFGVPAGQTLSLVGHAVQLFGGDAPDVIRSPGSRVQLVAGGAGVDVPLDAADLDPLAVSPYTLGEVRAEGGAGILVSSAGQDVPAGSIVIRGERFVMGDASFEAFHESESATALGPIDIAVTDSAVLVRSALLTRATAGGRSGDVRIRAGGDVTLTGTVFQTGATSTLDNTPGVAESGDLVLEAGSLRIDGASELQTISRDSESGAIVLDAGSIEITGAGTAVFTRSLASGTSGEVRISAEALTLGDEAQVTSQALGSGAAGDVGVEAAELVVQNATLASQSAGDGAAGSLGLDATHLTVRDAARVTTRATAGGSGGDIVLAAEALTLMEAATISSDASGTGAAGAISLEGAQIDVLDGSLVASTTATDARGADIALAGGAIHVSNTEGNDRGTTITAQTLSGSTGTGGDIRISADRLTLGDGGNVLVSTQGAGDAGALEVDVDSVAILGADPLDTALRSGLFSQAAEGSSGDAGRLRIGGRILEVDDGGQISAISFGSGNAGVIEIGRDEARLERFTLRGGPTGASEVNTEAVIGDGGAIGDSGNITIAAERFELLDGGQVSTLSQGSGDAGDLLVQVAELVISGVQDPNLGANPSGLFSTVPRDGGSPSSEGGDIAVLADRSIRLDAGGQISTTTLGLRTGGRIDVRSPDIEIAGVRPGPVSQPSGVFSNSAGFAIADAGRIVVAADRTLALRDGGSITTETLTSGNAGQIEVSSGDLVSLTSGATISASSQTETSQPGDAGTIEVFAGSRLELTDSRIETSATLSAGGQVRIETGDTIELRRSSIASRVLRSRPDEERGGGDVQIETVQSLYLFDSEITTSVLGGQQRGGNIEIDPQLVVLNSSVVKAEADEGFGGFIRITADQFLPSLSSTVSAASGNPALSGTVVIDSPDSTVTGELTPLPERFLDVTSLVTNVCDARTARAGSLVVDDRGALPPPPDALLSPSAPANRSAPDPACARAPAR